MEFLFVLRYKKRRLDRLLGLSNLLFLDKLSSLKIAETNYLTVQVFLSA